MKTSTSLYFLWLFLRLHIPPEYGFLLSENKALTCEHFQQNLFHFHFLCLVFSGQMCFLGHIIFTFISVKRHVNRYFHPLFWRNWSVCAKQLHRLVELLGQKCSWRSSTQISYPLQANAFLDHFWTSPGMGVIFLPKSSSSYCCHRDVLLLN